MLEFEKNELRQHFDEQKHHVVVSINIFLYLFRWRFLDNLEESKGKTFVWQEHVINDAIDNVVPNYV